ncbi:MAG TPA: acyltransferase [Terracidiphilus sp.]|nr:acyltransferase [Terracidiphilus sp.]
MRLASRVAANPSFSSNSTPALETGKTAARRFTLADIDHRDSNILKGLAIAAIVFHNFFHVLSSAHQNEFTFDASRLSDFFGAVVHPPLTIQALFSFFGHFGVEVFIFLSAYGLTKSHWNDTSSWTEFMWGRIKKLYPKFGLVILPWAIATCLFVGPIVFFRQSGLELLLMVLGVSTILGFLMPPVGPWWFIPFIMQFYAIWPAMRKLTARFGWKGLLVLAILCRVATYATFPFLARWRLDLLLTPIGHMTELCLGIVAARYRLRITAPFAFLSGVVLFLGSEYEAMWLFTFLAALLISLWVYSLVRTHLRKVPLLQRLGEYSLLVFLINAIVRNQFLNYVTSPASQIFWGCVSAVVSFLIAAIIQDWLLPRPPRATPVPAMHAPKELKPALNGIRSLEQLP